METKEKKVVKMYGVVKNGVSYTILVHDDKSLLLYLCGIDWLKEHRRQAAEKGKDANAPTWIVS